MEQPNANPDEFSNAPTISKAKSTPPSWARPIQNDATEEIEEELKKHGLIPLEEKRKLYLCHDNYITLEDVVVWPLQWKMMREKSSKKPCYLFNNNISMKISLIQNDITKLEIDAIVNAANNPLAGGGGVDGCIHRAAGKSQLRKACKKLNGCSTGCSKITPGYNLPAKYIIHTVGPIGENAVKLRGCYESSLDLAVKYNIRTIAFCCISTGVYGYPNDSAAQIALETTRKWLNKNEDKMDRIIFCTFLNQDFGIYQSLLPVYFPCEDVKPVNETEDHNSATQDGDDNNDENNDDNNDIKNDVEDHEDIKHVSETENIPDLPSVVLIE